MQIKLVLQVSEGALHTAKLPWTVFMLQKLLPGVLKSTCFNDSDLPFSIEAKNTETGHLFEHILLECLCLEKLSHGHKKAAFAGETCWNWKKEERGTFNITINLSQKDCALLPNALNRSINLFKLIVAEESLSLETIYPIAKSYQDKERQLLIRQ